MLNIVSYNINGIRAALRKDFLGWLKVFSPDIVCLQEIKANTDPVSYTHLRAHET